MTIISWNATFYGDSTVKIKFTSGQFPNFLFGIDPENIKFDIHELNLELDKYRIEHSSAVLTLYILNKKTGGRGAIRINLAHMTGWNTDLSKVVEQQGYIDISSELTRQGIMDEN